VSANHTARRTWSTSAASGMDALSGLAKRSCTTRYTCRSGSHPRILLGHFLQQIVQPVHEGNRVFQLPPLAQHGLVQQHI